MAKDRLKRRIAEALLGSSVRDELRLILAGDELGSTAAHAVLHPILENVKDPILAVAADGIVHEANSAAARLLDAAVEDIVGRDVARFVPTLAPALPVLEALACGAPVVTSAGTAMAEVADGAAVLVDPLDAEAIADGIRRAIASRSELSARGPERARAYTWRASAEATVAVYRELA